MGPSRKLATALVTFTIAMGLIACGGGGGGGGGDEEVVVGAGAGPEPLTGYGASASDFGNLSEFHTNPSVQRLLDAGGLSISHTYAPPNIEGEYDYSGRVEYSEILPQYVGAPLNGSFTFRDQVGDRITFIEHSPVFGDIVAHGSFINGYGAYFTISYTVEMPADLGVCALTEVDVGILNGRVTSGGNLELEFGVVAVGVSGSCVPMLRDQGYDLASLIGKPHVSSCIAEPK